MRKVLVTGGMGYIGSHTVVALHEAGYAPVILDNLSNSVPGVLGQLTQIIGYEPPFYELDLCQSGSLQKVFSEQPDLGAVIHFAALKSVSESVQEPLRYYHNNLGSLTNLLQAFSKASPLHFVFSSSCTVYGQPDALPVNEAAPLKKASSPYGHTKQVGEEVLRFVAQQRSDLKVIALRYFNPVGAHPSALIGELPLGVPQNLVPFITQSAIGKRGPLTVYGDDYATPDGTAIRDYIHVMDLAMAHVAALQLLERGNPNGNFDVFNIGTGRGHSVMEVIKTFEASTGVPLHYHVGPRRAGDIEQVWADVEKSSTQLGWKAKHALPEMLQSAWAWERYLSEHPLTTLSNSQI